MQKLRHSESQQNERSPQVNAASSSVYSSALHVPLTPELYIIRCVRPSPHHRQKIVENKNRFLCSLFLQVFIPVAFGVVVPTGLNKDEKNNRRIKSPRSSLAERNTYPSLKRLCCPPRQRSPCKPDQHAKSRALPKNQSVCPCDCLPVRLVQLSCLLFTFFFTLLSWSFGRRLTS